MEVEIVDVVIGDGGAAVSAVDALDGGVAVVVESQDCVAQVDGLVSDRWRTWLVERLREGVEEGCHVRKRRR